MPYITKERRNMITGISAPLEMNAGDLNYLFTECINIYRFNKGKLSYSVINDVLGALEGAKLEFYRRIAVPYENTKMSLNGDVY